MHLGEKKYVTDSARRALEEADAQIRHLDQQRGAAEARVAESRDAIEQAPGE